LYWHFNEPFNNFAVIEFSRKTGDYGSLSVTDLKVLALTYMLEVQHVGVSHLSTEPTIRPTVEITKPQKLSQEVNADGSKAEVPGHQRIVGFVHPKHDDDEDGEEDDDDEASDAREQEHGGDKVSSHIVIFCQLSSIPFKSC
jgi:RNA-binding protein NOB1